MDGQAIHIRAQRDRAIRRAKAQRGDNTRFPDACFDVTDPERVQFINNKGGGFGFFVAEFGVLMQKTAPMNTTQLTQQHARQHRRS